MKMSITLDDESFADLIDQIATAVAEKLKAERPVSADRAWKPSHQQIRCAAQGAAPLQGVRPVDGAYAIRKVYSDGRIGIPLEFVESLWCWRAGTTNKCIAIIVRGGCVQIDGEDGIIARRIRAIAKMAETSEYTEASEGMGEFADAARLAASAVFLGIEKDGRLKIT